MIDEDIWSDTDSPEYPFKTRVFLACLIACGLITAGAVLREWWA